MKIFHYGKTELEYLMLRDNTLSNIIESRGILKFYVYENIFEGIVSQILAQQVHRKTHLAIFDKLKHTVSYISPKNILYLGYENLKQIGISSSKCNCICELSERCLSGKLNLQEFHSFSDTQIINILTEIKGIGKWTAEMVLIFSLERKNVLSFTDYGIRKGIELIYKKSATKSFYTELCERYSPYSTIASFYIWSVGNNGLPI